MISLSRYNELLNEEKILAKTKGGQTFSVINISYLMGCRFEHLYVYNKDETISLLTTEISNLKADKQRLVSEIAKLKNQQAPPEKKRWWQ